MGYEIVKMPSFDKLQQGVSTHVDMLLFFDGDSIVTHVDYYNENKGIFDSLGVNVITTDECVEKAYPNDILFNCILTNNKVLFAKKDCASRLIRERVERIVDVKQGYTACSTCRVSDDAFITTDMGLYKAYTANNIDCLLVEKEGISLPGYDCGFVGGASVVLDDSVCFFGDVTEHKDYKNIVSFVEKYGKKVVSLSNEKLTDIGGSVVL